MEHVLKWGVFSLLLGSSPFVFAHTACLKVSLKVTKFCPLKKYLGQKSRYLGQKSLTRQRWLKNFIFAKTYSR